mmetsp:Transcript_35669/g.75596  ORF Transcript_35669/g.75596 Transcript_35669/m.75596 type:complete len:97 (+) Transcript_35669:1930-2220(+)
MKTISITSRKPALVRRVVVCGEDCGWSVVYAGADSAARLLLLCQLFLCRVRDPLLLVGLLRPGDFTDSVELGCGQCLCRDLRILECCWGLCDLANV